MAAMTETRRGPLQRLQEAAAVIFGAQPSAPVPAPNAEMIGNYSVTVLGAAATRPVGPTVDATRPDYAYYDRLRRGKQATVKIGGMFADPITGHKKNWTLGRGFKAKTGHVKTDEALENFIRENLRVLKDAYKNGLDLGDAYIVVNADGTLTEATPDTVEPVHHPVDYRTVDAFVIRTQGETAATTDEYRADKRTVTVQVGATKTVKTYRNLIGRIPVCHYANRRTGNEIYGRPEVEPMLPAMMDYDDVYTKGSAGVKRMSGPTPVLEKITNPQTALQDLGAEQETYQAADGTTKTRYVVDFARIPGVVTTGEFNYKGPSSFTDDMWRVLKNLFYLMLQNSNVPEFIWGGAIASSKASVEAQMPGWQATVEDQRSSVEGWLTDICEIWLGITALSDGGVRAMPVEIEWPEVTDTAQSELRAMIDLIMKYGLVTDETALRLTQMVEDPEAEVARAREEAEARQKVIDAADRFRQFEDEGDGADGDGDEDEEGAA